MISQLLGGIGGNSGCSNGCQGNGAGPMNLLKMFGGGMMG
jgi:hypothetical protein